MKTILKVLLITLSCTFLTACQEEKTTLVTNNNDEIVTEISQVTSIKDIPEKEVIENETLEIAPLEKEETTNSTSQTITVSFAGDCILGSFKGQGGIIFENYYDENGYTWPFDGVRDVFENDDITFVNLECALTNQVQTADKEFSIKGKVEYVDCLLDGNVEVCNIANNHIYDCDRYTGLNETVDTLLKNDIGVCGEGQKFYTDCKGANMCFLGYRTFAVTDGLKNQVANDIYEARAQGSDIVIVEFHGGTEKEFYADPDQDEICRFAVDSGADIVVSSHPHVIQGFEVYNDKIIVHSMGNFVFGTNGHPKDTDTFIFQQEFIFDAENDTVTYGESTVIPCSVTSDSTRNNYQPMVYEFEGEDYKRVMHRLTEYSSPYEKTLPVFEFGGY